MDCIDSTLVVGVSPKCHPKVTPFVRCANHMNRIWFPFLKIFSKALCAEREALTPFLQVFAAE
jgi:hypothetical protein